MPRSPLSVLLVAAPFGAFLGLAALPAGPPTLPLTAQLVNLSTNTCWQSTFPTAKVNDGGFFFSMTRDLEASNFRIPAFTTYNGGHIPFAYPPLGFYLAAILDRVDALRPDVPPGMTMAEMALRFILANPDVSTIIPGMRRLRNVDANLGVSDGQALSEAVIWKLRQHRWVRTYFVP